MRESDGRVLSGVCGVAFALAACVWALAGADSAGAVACPNEAFRPNEATALDLGLGAVGANLPDCRAFEQVTAVNKNGGDATDTVPFAKASSSGSGVTFLSLSGVPGGEGAQDYPSYLADRGEGSWTTQGLLPPEIDGQDAALLGWTPDFSTVFTSATKLGSPSETELLARPGAGGLPTKVVDYSVGLAPSFAGTTEDGSLLFESPANLADGAVPGRPNVYLWDRGSGKVILVGVLNDENAPSQGAIAGPYDWLLGTNSATLSRGGASREYYTEEEHVIARDGSAAFFTAAGSGKLYERLNPGAEQSDMEGEKCIQPAKACTIEISASHKENGNGPGGTELGGPRPAAFQAASSDGKVAFFTSEEELTNDANTGPEPSEPPAQAFISRAELGSGGEIKRDCVPARASGLATDSSYIYWADSEAGAIGRATLDCNPASVKADFITGLAGIEDLAVGAGHIYWTVPGQNRIGRATIEGAGVENEFIKGALGPKGVAVGDGFVYWTNEEGHSLGRAPAGDGEAAEQDFIEFTESGKKVPTQGVAVDPVGEHIYVALRGVYIQSYGLDGKKDPVADLEFSSLGGDVDLALDETNIYWNYEETDGSLESLIGRAKLDLTGKENTFIKGAENPQSVAVAGEDLYWANDPPPSRKAGNDLYRHAAGSGGLEDLSADAGSENGAEVQGVLGSSADGSVVYFVANGDLDGAGEGKVGDCTGPFGTMSGECNLYRWEQGAGAPSFVARLAVDGSEAQTDSANWAATPTGVSPDASFAKTAQVSPDGQALLFRSRLQLTAYNNIPSDAACGREHEPPNKPLGCAEFYLYRVGTGIVCVSCNPSGAAPIDRADLGEVSTRTSNGPVSRPASIASHNLAAGGKRVFFETPDGLVGADTNGEASCPLTAGQFFFLSCIDVYEWEAAGTGSCEEGTPLYSPPNGGCLYLLSTGKEKEPALLADASASGEDAYFFTRASLVGQDKDELVDVYDVRAGGGLAAQNPPPAPPPCESAEGCHGPASSPPAEPALITPGFSGPGNSKPSHAKKHKAKRHKKHQKHRRSQAKRRAGR